MDHILFKSKPRLEIAQEKDSEDEFGLEGAFGFKAAPAGKPSTPHGQPKESDRQREVYLDRETGKIVVNPKRQDQTTGFKRGLDRRDPDEELQEPKNTGKHSVVGVSMGARVLKKIKRDNQKSETVHLVQESGHSFSNQGARSDVKLKNRPDPYAFVQFNPVVS